MPEMPADLLRRALRSVQAPQPDLVRVQPGALAARGALGAIVVECELIQGSFQLRGGDIPDLVRALPRRGMASIEDSGASVTLRAGNTEYQVQASPGKFRLPSAHDSFVLTVERAALVAATRFYSRSDRLCLLEYQNCELAIVRSGHVDVVPVEPLLGEGLFGYAILGRSLYLAGARAGGDTLEIRVNGVWNAEATIKVVDAGTVQSAPYTVTRMFAGQHHRLVQPLVYERERLVPRVQPPTKSPIPEEDEDEFGMGCAHRCDGACDWRYDWPNAVVSIGPECVALNLTCARCMSSTVASWAVASEPARDLRDVGSDYITPGREAIEREVRVALGDLLARMVQSQGISSDAGVRELERIVLAGDAQLSGLQGRLRQYLVSWAAERVSVGILTTADQAHALCGEVLARRHPQLFAYLAGFVARQAEPPPDMDCQQGEQGDDYWADFNDLLAGT